MANEDIERRFKTLMTELKTALKPIGYVKQGQRFRRLIERNVALIEVQRSALSDDTAIRLTINLGVISARLLDSELDIMKVGSDRAHFRERLGFLLPDPHDKWWELNGSESDSLVFGEVVALITDEALPFLNEHTSDAGLTVLWSAGRSPGLTKGQRLRYLGHLRNAA